MRIQRLGLRAADPVALTGFYRDVLGLPVAGNGEAGIRVQAGETRMDFTPATGGTKPYYHIAFNIPENKIEQAMNWAAGRIPLVEFAGVGEPLVHFEAINAHSIYFWDPAGNLLELIARHDLNNAAAGPFHSEEFLSCSEIGLVVDDVQGTVSRIEEDLGVGVYPPSRTPSDEFSMIGDADGTFIVVRRERIWLMTEDLPAVVFPTEIHIDAARAAELQLDGLPYTIRSG